MTNKNHTLVKDFLLLGFGNLHEFKILVFTVFLVLHIIALTSNVLVVVLVVFIRSLHSPMYIFISQLSLSEIVFTSNIVPNMLWLILVGGGKVSVARCFFQFYLLAVPVVAQCLLLASMSFDRYLAICKPLHYASIMSIRHQLKISTFCWSMALMIAFVLYALLCSIEFCGPNTIDHFFCDISPVVELSCSGNPAVQLVTFVFSFPFVVCPFMFIIATYISILRTILKIPSTTGRHKAFSTCSSHLIIVNLYYGTLAIGSTPIFPSNINSVSPNKILSLLYIFLTPLINPLIYSLRNQEMRNVIRKFTYV
ncbi:olfactory receptor 10A3-like [Aquarana catesbeiana]|uniref:olfactory receptor 10A3-like n=1 Tax=Aquarana catesbeiana TaxID=8400 RepID=UPI003CC97DD1